jgi:hypothetical protein
MTDENEILRVLERIEGRMNDIANQISKLSDRVAKLELWQAGVKGAWTALAVVLGFLFGTFLK